MEKRVGQMENGEEGGVDENRSKGRVICKQD